MQKKLIVALIIIALFFVMIMDFKINGVKVFETFVKNMETDSFKQMRSYQGVDILSSDFTKRKVLDTKELAADPAVIKSLFIRNQLGSIEIVGEKRDNIVVDSTINVYANQEVSNAFIEDIDISIIDKSSSYNISLENPGVIPNHINGIGVDYKVKVPEELALDLYNQYGKVTVNNIKNDVDVRNSYDLVDMNDINGNINLRNRFGKLTVKDITGKAEINARHCDIVDISNISDKLEIDSEFSQVELNDINARTDLDFHYGSLVFNNLNDIIELKSSFTAIQGRNVNHAVEADMRYGAIDLTDVAADIIAEGNFSAISVRLSSELEDYQLDCQTKYKKIKTNLPFEIEKDDNYEILQAKKGTGDVEIIIESRHGDIAIFQ